MASRDHHGHTHTQPRPQTNTHIHSFKRKGNPDTLHWHSRHLLPSLQIQWQLFLSNPSNPLAHLTHTHAHPVSHTQTDVHRDSWNTHPLLWCWWLRNCHNPFCIDAATVQAERTRLMSGWTGRTGGECTTHWEKRGKWAGEVTEAQREGRSKEMPSRDLHWLYPPPVFNPCACLMRCNEELRVKWQHGERGFYTHTPHSLTRENEGEGGMRGERERKMLYPHMICSFPPPWQGCPGNQGKRGGGWSESQPIRSFLYI